MRQNGNQLNKAIFFDRDGVVNKSLILNNKPFPPKSIEDLVVYECLPAILKKLRENMYLTFIITNQPDVKRGTVIKKDVDKINEYLMQNYDFDDLFCCFHDDDDNCICRKPKPGAILFLAKKYNIDLKKSFMIGDRKKDVLAADNAGCRSIFIDMGYNENKPNTQSFTATSLEDAINFILG